MMDIAGRFVGIVAVVLFVLFFFGMGQLISDQEISPANYKKIELFLKDKSISSESKRELGVLIKNSMESNGVITNSEGLKIEKFYRSLHKNGLREALAKEESKYGE